MTKLDAIAVQFYRGIGSDTQYICHLSKMNVLIGANNAGKSIVLNLIADHVTSFLTGNRYAKLSYTDQYRGTPSGNFMLALGVPSRKVQEEMHELVKSNPLRNRWLTDSQIDQAINQLVTKVAVHDHVWVSVGSGAKEIHLGFKFQVQRLI
jgi:ATPase subunit of ABC transporter with duplicated ATPase domains